MLTCLEEAVLHGTQLGGDGGRGGARVDADEALPAGSFQEAGAGGLRSFPLSFRLLAQVQAGFPRLSQHHVQGAARNDLQSCNGQNRIACLGPGLCQEHAQSCKKQCRVACLGPVLCQHHQMGCGAQPVSHT